MSNLIRRFEVRNRTEHHSPAGSEVVIEYRVIPYKARPMVVSTLLGHVDITDPANPRRMLPARDGVYPWYYCQEVEDTQVCQQAIAGGISTGFNPNDNNSDHDKLRDATYAEAGKQGRIVNADGVLQAELDGLELTQSVGLPPLDSPLSAIDRTPTSDLKVKRALIGSNVDTRASNIVPPDSAGSIIRATYRPIVSVYKPSSEGQSVAASDDPRLFDYCNPHFEPLSRLIRIDKSAKALLATPGAIAIGANKRGYDAGINAWAIEHWQRFTIQRLMCPSVPWKTIGQLSNTVNASVYNPGNFTLPNLPDGFFYPETLRFDGAAVTEMIVPLAYDSDNMTLLDSIGVNPIAKYNRWYNIEYQFSWRTTWAPRFDVAGNKVAAGWIGWNTVFAGPFASAWGLGLLPWAPAWYDVEYNLADGFMGLLFGKFRKPYTTMEVTPAKTFDRLFELTAP